MASKISWVLVLVLGAGLAFSVILWNSEKSKRHQVENELAVAEQKANESRAAADKAVKARQESEAARQKLDAAIAASSADLSVARGQVKELREQFPKLEADAAQARQTLAEVQRQFPNVVPAKTVRPKPAATPKHNAGSWSVAELLPANTLGVITVRDIPVTIEKAKETGLFRILSSPEFERVVKLPVSRAQGYMMMAEMLMNEKFSQIATLFMQGEITFAVLGVDKRGPNGAPLPDAVLGIQLGDKSDAFMAEFNKRLDQLKAATHDVLTSSQGTLGNTRFTQLRHPDFPLVVSCCLTENTFLVCVGEGRLEKLLAMREASKAGKAADVLAQVPAYKRALEKAGPDADAILYVNVQAIAANPMLNTREMTPTQKHDLELSGLTEVQAVTYSMGIKDSGVREALFLDIPADKRKGVIGLVDGESADLKGFYAAPRNSVLAGVFKISPDKLLDKAVELAAVDNPKVREDVAAGLFFIGEQLKIDVKKDLLDVFSGEGVFSLSVPAKNAKLSLAFPQPLLALKVKNKDGLKTMLTAVLTATVDKVQVSEVNEAGKAIVIVRQRVADEGRDPVQLCYTIDDSDLIVSLYPLALREEIKRRAANTSRLEDDPDFNQARANLNSQPQGLFYVDTAALATAAYDLLAPVAQIRERNPEVNLNALPSADLLNQNLGGALYGLQFAADGIYVEGYSPAGLGALLLPAAIVIPMIARNRAMAADAGGAPGNNAAPAAAPAFGNPRVEARKIDALGKLNRDLSEFAKEHAGNFPATLDEMKPKYLQDLGGELEYIVYRGKQAADNLVLAHSSEKLPGPISVLLQNGNIQSVARQQLGQTLKFGLTHDASKEKPPGTKAVKPPKPPEF